MRTWEERERDVAALADDILRQPDVRRGLVEVLRAQESRLDDYADVVALIPRCPHRSHGPECTAHAREWIGAQRAKALGLWDAEERGEGARPGEATGKWPGDKAGTDPNPFFDLYGSSEGGPTLEGFAEVARYYEKLTAWLATHRRLTEAEERTLATELAAGRRCPECQHLYCLHTFGSDGYGDHCNVDGCHCRASTSAW